MVGILPPEPQKAPKTGLQPENVVDSLPVSYTHLDVYKRQGPRPRGPVLSPLGIRYTSLFTSSLLHLKTAFHLSRQPNETAGIIFP